MLDWRALTRSMRLAGGRDLAMASPLRLAAASALLRPQPRRHAHLRRSAQGKAPRQAVEKLQSSFMPVFRAGWVFWPAANMVNFLMVPPTQRVLYVNGAGLLWNAYLRRVRWSSI